jgi:antitoxin component YwqK of YwqJK toxin-antitoxin module
VKRKLLITTVSLALALSCGVSIESAFAEQNRKPKPEASTKQKRKYVHPCPAGTEQAGSGPPDGYKAYCRQPIIGGYRNHGGLTNWYANGEKRFEGEFIRGKKHGVWTIYHRNGEKKSVETWYNGERQNKVKFDRKGAPVTEVDKDKERREKRQKYKWRNDMKH